jgi:hypothetical protein
VPHQNIQTCTEDVDELHAECHSSNFIGVLHMLHNLNFSWISYRVECYESLPERLTAVE